MTLSRREAILSAGGLLLASALPAQAAGTHVAPSVLQGTGLGSTWTLVTGGRSDVGALRTAFTEAIASVDQTMSPFRPDSELSLFNRTAATDWFPLSDGTCAVLAEGLRMASLTAGAFNPTLGPLVAHYGFSPIKSGRPGAANEVSVRADAARKARADLSLDLCGIAKGFALDRMRAVCIAHGLTDFLIELGGEVFAQGRHPDGRAWRAGIERPVPESGDVQRVVALDGAALATSGDRINGYFYRGRRYGHIIDPLTAEPVDSPLASVTVAAARAMTADALATALFAMGAERGPAFAHETGIEALFILRDGARLREVTTAGFEARIIA